MNNSCPHCGSQINDGFNYCPACTRIVQNYQNCEKCIEPYSDSAENCPHCQHKTPSQQQQLATTLDLEVQATRVGALFTGGSITALFFPPIIKVSNGRINVTKWSFLGLRTHHQEIQVTRVASVRYTKGIIWGGLLVETFGGAAEDLSEKGLRQEDAKLMAEQLKSCLKD
ncbi:zinc ribbon domain-containing protein [Lentisphaera profundi]|uniref:Zinc ribbon domain-containing protein n=1 Tax=Lentisphaera profundi TaxID=1658616 RepID=A0ABY7VSG6_9BACT|nr:zinc ribbon domain-containing protein [Lentisphaera profundi]WDE96841.1 zinc ribbon domain-containing protein [Lentisphaera profundi]